MPPIHHRGEQHDIRLLAAEVAPLGAGGAQSSAAGGIEIVHGDRGTVLTPPSEGDVRQHGKDASESRVDLAVIGEQFGMVEAQLDRRRVERLDEKGLEFLSQEMGKDPALARRQFTRTNAMRAKSGEIGNRVRISQC
jgi:hypothetical protein